MKQKIKKRSIQLKEGFYRGLGWSFGVTVGFVFISTVGIMLLQKLGGLPIIGKFIADIVEATNAALQFRRPPTTI